MLFQMMLDFGIPPSAKVAQSGNVFTVDNAYLITCFMQVDTEFISEIAKCKPCDAAFRDSTMVSFEQVFNTYSSAAIRRVL